MRFDRISLLVDQLRTPLGEMAWFHSTAANAGTAGGQDYGDMATAALLQQQVRSKQTGVVRSNCMDCLDRTNVSQSALGKWAANEQLRSVGVLNEKESIEDWPEFMAMFRTGKPLVFFPAWIFDVLLQVLTDSGAGVAGF